MYCVMQKFLQGENRGKDTGTRDCSVVQQTHPVLITHEIFSSGTLWWLLITCTDRLLVDNEWIR